MVVVVRITILRFQVVLSSFVFLNEHDTRKY